jgi:hypothetical protein
VYDNYFEYCNVSATYVVLFSYFRKYESKLPSKIEYESTLYFRKYFVRKYESTTLYLRTFVLSKIEYSTCTCTVQRTVVVLSNEDRKYLRKYVVLLKVL